MATLDFSCSAECLVAGIGSTPTPDARHINTVQGSGFTNQNTIAIDGGRAFRFNPSGTECHIRKTTTSCNQRHWRFYVRFETLPSVDTTLLRFQGVAGTACYLRYRTATKDIIAAIGTSVTGATGQVITTGVWYRVEFKADMSTGTRTASLIVDGVSKGTVSASIAASTSTQWRVGASCDSESLSADMFVTWISTGTNIADYPLGPGRVKALFPNRDGTHSFSATGDFADETGTGIAPGATTTWAKIAHGINAISTYLNAALAGTTEYLEWGFDSLTGAGRINGVEVVSAHHAATTTANKQSARIVDGGSAGTIFDDADFSQTTIAQNSHHFPTAPSTAVAWTVAQVNALLVRWGSSWTSSDVDPDAYIDSILLEVDYVPATYVDCEGAATIALTAAGDLTIDAPSVLLAGSAVLRLFSSGSLQKDQLLAGASTLALTATGDMRQTQIMAGNALIVLASAADILLGVDCAGAAAITMEAGGNLRGSQRLAGDALTRLTAAGAVRQVQALSGTAALALTSTGSLALLLNLAGSAVLALLAEGTLAQSLNLMGAAVARLNTSGTVRQSQRLTGAATIGLDADASLTLDLDLAGAARVELTAAGHLRQTLGLAGSATLAVGASGRVYILLPLAGAATIAIDSTGALTQSLRLGGAATISLEADGALSQSQRMAGAALLQLVASGDLHQSQLLAGAAVVGVTAAGELAIKSTASSCEHCADRGHATTAKWRTNPLQGAAPCRT